VKPNGNYLLRIPIATLPHNRVGGFRFSLGSEFNGKKGAKTMKPCLESIHESLVNGQRKQMANQIDQYGLYDFWFDYGHYLFETYSDLASRHAYFRDAVISYHRIKYR